MTVCGCGWARRRGNWSRPGASMPLLKECVLRSKLSAHSSSGWRAELPRALASTAVVSGLVAAIGAITGPLTARALGTDGRGALAMIQAWPLLLTAIGGFGLTEAAAYFCARRPRQSRAVLSTTLVLALPLSGIA